MVATVYAPVTEQDLKNVFELAEIIDIPASIQDYWRLLELPQYRLDYINQHIKGTMSYGSITHERIVKNLIFLLVSLLEDEGYEVFPSNRPIFAEKCGEVYQSDVHLAKTPIKIYNYDKTKTATANPIVIIEVHSLSTRSYDLGEKLECYKEIASVKQIIFIESTTLKVTTYMRTAKEDQWLLTTYKEGQKVKILNKTIMSNKIYKNVTFD